MRLTLGTRALDLVTRSLVIGVVDGSAPGLTERARTLVADGADLVEVVLDDDPVAASRHVEAVVTAVAPSAVAVAVAVPCPEVAAAAFAAGAVLATGNIAGALHVTAEAGASVILHGSGPDVRADLAARAQEAEAAGLPLGRIVVEPVFNGPPALHEVRRVAELGYPVLVTIPEDDRDRTLAATALAIVGGCRLVRTPDVRGARRIADVLAAVFEARS